MARESRRGRAGAGKDGAKRRGVGPLPEKPHPGGAPAAMASGIREIDVAVPGPAGSLAGTLCLPAGSPAYPAVLFLGGSLPQTRDGNVDTGRRDMFPTPVPARNLLREAAAQLARQGVASLRYDKRGCGASAGDFDGAGLFDLVADARAALAHLQNRPEIDGARTGLVGHSEGGTIGAMIASAWSPPPPAEGDARPPAAAPSFLVLQGTPAGNLRDVFRWQRARNRAFWDGSEEAQARNRRSHPFLYWAYRQIEAFYAAVEAGHETFRLGDGAWSFPLPLRWWREHFANPPAPYLARIACPVLVLQGSEDRNVPPEDAEEVGRLIRSGGNEEVTVRLLPGLEHSFRRVTGTETSCLDAMARPADPAYHAALAPWVADHARAAGRTT